MEKVLVTGGAGFIGFHLTQRLLNDDFDIYSIDNMNDYYNVNLKYDRLSELGIWANENMNQITHGKEINSIAYTYFRFNRIDIQDKDRLFNLFANEKFDYVIHLAAQAGVRYSIENPEVYIENNIIGFFNILEACRHYPVKKLIYASSSSVYGDNTQMPFSIKNKTDAPISLYAATKKSNELMAHAYSHLYNIETVGLRFFTVYGSWGRPDMSPILFADAITKNQPIQVFNNGELERDFTHVSDITEGIARIIHANQSEQKKYLLFNIGNGHPVKLLDFINTIEKELNKKAELLFVPMQAGDVKQTWAETLELEEYCNYKPTTTIQQGIKEFIKWYQEYNLRKNNH